MNIPPFDSNGLLPPFIGTDATTADRSPYFVSIEELVVRFGTTSERQQLLRNLIDYRRILGGDGYTEGLQFIDGSFVEEIERIQGRPPNDIDVFSLLSAPQKYLSDPVAWQTSGIAFWKQEVIDRERNKLRLALDTYAILTQEMSLSMLVKDVIYWYGLFAHQRGTFAWKGFTIVPLDVAGDKAALATLGSA